MSSNPVVNTQLLDLTMSLISKRPDDWEQGDWVEVKYDPETDEPCGTTCCFAGHALLLSGDYEAVLYTDPEDYEFAELVEIETGEEVSDPAAEAANVLGLTDREAKELFYGYNRIENIKYIVEAIKNGSYRNG